ncbi:MAG TPA: amidohydrolase family protein [Terriglobales bacterium]|nr:amidohydrolase family protein [Terriglobales bacterium]
MTVERIDAHHHLWKYSREQYPWMADNMDELRRDFLVDDLSRVLREASIQGVVTVQARQMLEETEWLLGLAEGNDFMQGVVGWVPLVEEGVRYQLDKLSVHTKLKAVRHVLHDEPDDFYMLRGDFNRGVAHLKDFNLRYDILVFERQLPQTIEFVDRHPQQVFIVDHIAKPRIKDGLLSPWRENMVELGRRENVYCKLSGMVTEANWAGWTESDLQPYFEIAMEAFGPGRLMFGSDWPVILLASSYQRWLETVQCAISGLSPDEQTQILSGTATTAYQL